MASRDHRRPAVPGERDQELLAEAVAQAQGLLKLLEDMLPEQTSSGPQTGTIGRHAPESSEPWHKEAADAYWRIHFGSRKLADAMRTARALPLRPWGSSNGLTAILALAPGVGPQDLAEALRSVEGWVTAAQRIRDIDEAETWLPLPRPPGVAPPACPYCKTLSLRMAVGKEQVRCFYPGCRDLDGRPTRARMEVGQLTATGALVFGDGTTVAYRGGHE